MLVALCWEKGERRWCGGGWWSFEVLDVFFHCFGIVSTYYDHVFCFKNLFHRTRTSTSITINFWVIKPISSEWWIVSSCPRSHRYQVAHWPSACMSWAHLATRPQRTLSYLLPSSSAQDRCSGGGPLVLMSFIHERMNFARKSWKKQHNHNE